MPSRFRDAIAIQAGASNPSGVARALVRAIDEAREECPDTDAIRSDPACRLICHQLAFLMGTDQLNESFHEYNRLIDICNAGE